MQADDPRRDFSLSSTSVRMWTPGSTWCATAQAGVEIATHITGEDPRSIRWVMRDLLGLLFYSSSTHPAHSRVSSRNLNRGIVVFPIGFSAFAVFLCRFLPYSPSFQAHNIAHGPNLLQFPWLYNIQDSCSIRSLVAESRISVRRFLLVRLTHSPLRYKPTWKLTALYFCCLIYESHNSRGRIFHLEF